jgi:hypothetical protein
MKFTYNKPLKISNGTIYRGQNKIPVLFFLSVNSDCLICTSINIGIFLSLITELERNIRNFQTTYLLPNRPKYLPRIRQSLSAQRLSRFIQRPSL